MSNIIRLKIDVTKIDKSRLFIAKSGAKYLDATCIPSNGQYGDTHMIVEDVSKEEREAGKKGTIIGNAKEFGVKPAPRHSPQQNEPSDELGDDSIPF
jgi:hypothetical protein